MICCFECKKEILQQTGGTILITEWENEFENVQSWNDEWGMYVTRKVPTGKQHAYIRELLCVECCREKLQKSYWENIYRLDRSGFTDLSVTVGKKLAALSRSKWNKSLPDSVIDNLIKEAMDLYLLFISDKNFSKAGIRMYYG